MNIKKFLSFTISILLSAGCFTGCSSKASESEIQYGEYPADYTPEYNIQIPSETEAGKSFDFKDMITNEGSALNSIAADCLPQEFPYLLPENTEEYNYIEENGFVSTITQPLSTFSSDVDTASYTNLRRMILNNQDIPIDAIRIEEMLNYFDYDYEDPKEGEPFSVYTELAPCPWNDDTELLMIGLNTKGFDTILEDRPPMNLVFLIDVSGSMYDDNKLPLVQESFKLLTENLNPDDKISIVTYAGSDAVLLEGATGDDKEEITSIINSLEAGGSTAGAAGINTAYEIARNNFIEGGNNRIILATDGDLNVGLQSESELTRLVEEQRLDGICLSVLGFGSGNYKDNRMEALADNGNGNYSYIDNLNEAKRVLVNEMSSTLFTAAKDVKFQVEFNPSNIKGYRLIGYENRKMDAADFEDDTKDAGDIGAGHSVTVLYELVSADSEIDISSKELKYSQALPEETLSDELLTISIRYKEPDEDESKLLEYPVEKSLYKEDLSDKLNFASSVAEFGMLLRNSSYINDITYKDILDQLKLFDYSNDEYKDEFEYLVKNVNRNNPKTID